MKNTTESNKIQCINGIRGLACIIVLIAHIVASDPNIGIYANGCGKIGVWCFVVMSGFLSIYPFLDIRKDEHYGFRHILCYYLKKIIKLYPTYIIVVILAYCFGILNSIKEVINHLMFKDVWGHFWYMPVIIKFYIVFPLFVMVLKAVKNNQLVYSGVCTVAGIVLSVVFPFFEYTENSTELRWYLPTFIIGILLAVFYQNLQYKVKKHIAFDLLFILGLLSILVTTPLLREIIWSIQASSWLQNKYILIGGLWALIIMCVLKSKIVVDFFDKNLMLNKLGDVSYEIYLIHFIILFFLGGRIESTLIKGLIVITLSFAIAILIHEIGEYIHNLAVAKIRKHFTK